VAEGRIPSEEELEQALGQLAVSDVLLQSLTLSVSLGYARLAPGTRDLGQVRLAIEALRALEPVLREGGVEDAILRDLEQARANLQLAYANAVTEREASERSESRSGTAETDDAGRDQPHANHADADDQTAPEVPGGAGEPLQPSDSDP